MPLGMIAAQAAGAGMGLLMEKGQNRRQLKQQEKLQRLQIQGNKEMTDYQAAKELEMWQNTSYPAQMAMMKEAGINPALMYGMGGGGGQTVGGSGGGVSGGSATGASAQGMAGAGMGLAMKAQVELLQAQKENIEADTENKQAEEVYTAGAKTINTEEDSKLKAGQAWETNLRAALADYVQMTDEKGNSNVGMGGSMAVKEKKLDLILKDEGIRKIGQEIALMKAKGLSEGEVYQNLMKEGKLLQAEIDWNALDVDKDNWGAFILKIVKAMFSPMGSGQR